MYFIQLMITQNKKGRGNGHKYQFSVWSKGKGQINVKISNIEKNGTYILSPTTNYTLANVITFYSGQREVFQYVRCGGHIENRIQIW